MVTELRIFVGSKVRIFGEWHQPGDLTKVPDATDPLTDPSGLSLKIYKPDRTTVTYVYLTDGALVKDAVGKYHADYIPTVPGLHRWFWLPTGNAAQPSEGDFYAHPV